MRIGIVCPYAWDVPGGVSAHVHDLAIALERHGHSVSVLAPAESDENLPEFVVSAGSPTAVRYNGSVARVSFGPVSAWRVSRWIAAGNFDIVHVHEPLAPSLSSLACWASRGPLVATWHASYENSRMLRLLNHLALTAMEKITARIAVSEAARSTLVEHVGGDAVIIPNGVDTTMFVGATPLPGWTDSDKTLVFLGRIDEPRKGLSILFGALPELCQMHPDLRVLVAGPGDAQAALVNLPEHLHDRVTFLGRVSDEEKAQALASGTIYVAPNTGGESFGIVLLEAMAAGTPVVATDLAAFVRVLNYGGAGRTFRNGDSVSLAHTLNQLLNSPDELLALKQAGLLRAAQFDWSHVVERILEVYESVHLPGVPVTQDMAGQWLGRLGNVLRWRP